MKHQGSIILLSIVSVILSPAIAFADTVVEGNASSHVSVTTNMQGSGSVHTHIETTVNGVTKTLDNNQPGTYTLNNDSNAPSQQASVPTSPTITPQASPTATILPKHHNLPSTSFTNHMRQLFHQLLQKILFVFHL